MKGFTTEKQVGKRDGRKYYQMKGVEGIVSSSINTGMSNRVKNSAEYANTRLNNAEFGAAGSTAGALVRAMSQHWRYILLPFACGKLAKDVRAFMMQDTTGAWGQRGLTGTSWQAPLAERVSQFSKNDVADYRGVYIENTFNSTSGVETYINFTDEWSNEVLKSKGADGVYYYLLSGAINAAKFNQSTGAYDNAFNDIEISDVHEVDLGTSTDDSMNNPKYKQNAQQSDMLIGGLVVFLPYKTINGTKHIMQELASFKMIAANA